MIRSGSTLTKVRRGSQIGFLLLFLLLFFQAQHLYTTGLPNDLFLRFSPLVPLFGFIDSFNLSLLFCSNPNRIVARLAITAKIRALARASGWGDMVKARGSTTQRLARDMTMAPFRRKATAA